MAPRYQVGGEVEELGVDDVDSGAGALGQLDPATMMMAAFGRFTTPEAQQYSKDILDELLASRRQPSSSTAIDAMKLQAEQVRKALRNARERLESQEYNKGELLLAASQAMGAPTRTGALGETVSNVFGAIREPLAQRRQFERDRDESYRELDLAEAQVDSSVTSAEFELEKLREQLDNRLQIEALENLGRTTLGRNPFSNVVPQSVTALNRAYAPEYLDFVQGGAGRGRAGIDTLSFAAKLLRGDSDALSGPYAGAIAQVPYVGRWLQAFTNQEGADVRDLIEYVVQEQLRPILGSQFTEREGERLISRLYNPNLEEWRNARRLEAFVQQLERAYKNRVDLAQFYRDNNNSLFGYEGPIGYSADDFRFDDVDQDEGSGMSPEARRSLQPGARLDSPEDAEFLQNNPQGNAKGGPVRRYQEGGPVLTLPDEVVVRPEEREEPTGMETAGQLYDLMGVAPDMVLGTGAGLTTEALLNNILRNVRGGVPEQRVEGAMHRAGLDPVSVAQDIKRGRRMGVPETLMDVDAPGMTVLSEEAFKYGEAGAARALRELRQRVEGSRGRVKERVNKGLKPYDYFDQENRLVNRIEVEGRRNLKGIFDQYEGMAMDPVISEILSTPEGQSALAEAMKFYENTPGKKPGKMTLDGMIAKPSLEFYDYIRKGFDQRIAQEGDTEFGEVIRNLRSTFLERVDAMAPEYQEGRQSQGTDIEVRDALRQGRAFEKLQHQQIAELIPTLTFHQKNAFRTGVAQRLYEMMDRSSAQGYQAAQRIVGSPEMMEKLRPLFDSEGEFKLFSESLRREAELFRTSQQNLSLGENAMLNRERGRMSPMEWLSKKAPGFRFAIAPMGMALRVIRDKPKLTVAEANKVLNLLRSGRTEEMDKFIRRAENLKRLRSRRGARGAAAAGLGAAAGAGMYMLRNRETETEEE